MRRGEAGGFGLRALLNGGCRRRRGRRRGQGDGHSLGAEELPLLHTWITEEAETMCIAAARFIVILFFTVS